VVGGAMRHWSYHAFIFATERDLLLAMNTVRRRIPSKISSYQHYFDFGIFYHIQIIGYH